MIASDLPDGYRVLRDADTLILVAPNGKDIGYFGTDAEPRHVSRTAYAHESQVNARIAHVARLLGRDGKRLPYNSRYYDIPGETGMP